MSRWHNEGEGAGIGGTAMEARTLLEALSVAEHSWMMTLMAFFMKDEFPDVDMDKVFRLIHLDSKRI